MADLDDHLDVARQYIGMMPAGEAKSIFEMVIAIADEALRSSENLKEAVGRHTELEEGMARIAKRLENLERRAGLGPGSN